MRKRTLIATVFLATMAGSAPALAASPSQDTWGVTQARLDAPSLDGDGLVVAVVDTGVDASHPALAGKVIGFHDLVDGQSAPYDDLGHGTWVSGIIAGRETGQLTAGVAPETKIVGVKVVDAASGSSIARIAEGIDWAVDHRADYGIDIINLSIGDPVTGGPEIDAAEAAVDRAVDAGLTVVAAAGGKRGLGQVSSPGSAERALTVGAMADPLTPAPLGGPGLAPVIFSSSGPTAANVVKPDVMGPTWHVAASPGAPGSSEGSGTSGAAAFTSGVAALMLDADPALTPAQIKALVMQTAQDWGSAGTDVDYGAGRLDAYAALHAAGAPLATPPAVPDHRTFNDTLPAGGTAEHAFSVDGGSLPLAATLLPTGTANLDLRLRDAGGVVDSSVTADRREAVSLAAPAAGGYVLEVSGPPGTAYSLDVSAALAHPDTNPPALTLDAPAAVISDGHPAISGHLGTASGDFPGVAAHVFQGATKVRAVRADLLAHGAWSAQLGSLPDGTYEVRAKQGDRRHNVSQQVATFTVDTTAPETTLDRTGTTFAFAANEPVARFECSLDGAAFGVCASPLSPADLAPGGHRLEVRAVDVAGNVDGTPAAVTWTVDAPAAVPPQSTPAPPPAADTDEPGLAFATSLPRGLAPLRGRGLVVSLRLDEGCAVHGELRIAAGLAKRLGLPKRLGSAGVQLSGAGTASLKLRPATATRKRLKRVTSLKAALVIVATDAAGNETRVSRSLRLR